MLTKLIAIQPSTPTVVVVFVEPPNTNSTGDDRLYEGALARGYKRLQQDYGTNLCAEINSKLQELLGLWEALKKYFANAYRFELKNELHPMNVLSEALTDLREEAASKYGDDIQELVRYTIDIATEAMEEVDKERTTEPEISHADSSSEEEASTPPLSGSPDSNERILQTQKSYAEHWRRLTEANGLAKDLLHQNGVRDADLLLRFLRARQLGEKLDPQKNVATIALQMLEGKSIPPRINSTAVTIVSTHQVPTKVGMPEPAASTSPLAEPVLAR